MSGYSKTIQYKNWGIYELSAEIIKPGSEITSPCGSQKMNFLTRNNLTCLAIIKITSCGDWLLEAV